MANIVEMPKLGFDMAEGTLVRWVRTEGETIQKGEVLAEIETDKATVEVESNFSGVIFRQLVNENDIVPIGTPIAIIAEKDEKVDVSALLGSTPSEEKPQPPKESSIAVQDQTPPSAAPSGLASGEKYPQGVKASPLARNIAKATQIDLTTIRGSGPGGRIVKRDVEAALQAPVQLQNLV